MGLLTSVGGIGLLFPPSLPIILVGTTTQTNIIHMFLGGLIPGIILAAALIIYGIGATGKIKIPRQKLEPRKAGASLRKYLWEILFALLLLTLRLGSLISNTTVILLMVLYFFVAGVMFHRALSWEILLPFILIAGYFTGTLSLVEIGAVAVVYTFFIEVFIFRDIKLSELRRVFAKSVPVIGGVLSILALSQALSYYIVDTRLPEFLARWMYGAIQSKFLFLLLLNLALLVVGCLMDIFSAILVVLPLISPLGAAYGIDPVHLGIIFLINLEVGFLTPPVGMNLFLAKYRFNKPFIEICRNVLPFLLIQLVVVALVTYVPILSTFLKDLFP
jgi:TRAP-type C4-dicarboxylate transport system permease large subunit